MLFQVLWLLAFFRRSKPIGGPLLVFFVQLFLSAFALPLQLIGILVAWKITARGVLFPPLFERQISLAVWTLFAVVLVTWITALFALRLLKTHERRNLVLVRGGLIALAFLAVIQLFEHSGPAAWSQAIFSFVFLAYFHSSQRVQSVFSQPEPSTPGLSSPTNGSV